MGATPTAKVKIRKKPDLVQDDALRDLFIKSLKDYCSEANMELDKKDIEIVVKEIIEVAGQTVKNTVDAFIDCYMLSVEEGEEDDEDVDNESGDGE